MTYCFDLDGTLCEMAKDGQSVYEVKPHIKRILKVNRLYEQGHTILIDTARGTRTGIEHQDRTAEQLSKWGLKYHILRTNTKFFADKYIDDRGLSDTEFFK